MARRTGGRGGRSDRKGRGGRADRADRGGRRAASGGSSGRRRGRDGDDDGERARPPRPSNSPVGFIVMGGVLVVGLIIMAVALSGKKPKRKKRSSSSGATAAAAKVDLTGARMATPKIARGGCASASVRVGGSIDTAGGRDNRYPTAACNKCGASLSTKVEHCPQCQAKLRYRKQITCPFCCKPENFKVAGIVGTGGVCAVCGGKGKQAEEKTRTEALPFGMSRTQGRVTRHGECAACKGSGACRWCKNQGLYNIPDTFGR